MLGVRCEQCMCKIFQVTRCMGVLRQMLFAEGLAEFVSKKFLKSSILEKLLLGASLQAKFHNLAILLK